MKYTGIILSASLLFAFAQSANANWKCRDIEKITPQALDAQIESGADVNKCEMQDLANEFTTVPLLVALARNPNPEVVKHLVDKGADVDMKDRFNDFTAMTVALQTSYYDLYEYISEKGVKADAPHDYQNDFSILMGSEVKDKQQKFDYLLTKIDVNLPVDDHDIQNFSRKWLGGTAQKYFGVTPLRLACADNDIQMAKLLIEKGADVNIVDEYGQNALYWAKSPEMLEILLSGGAVLDKTYKSAKEKTQTPGRYFMELARSSVERAFHESTDYEIERMKVYTAMINTLAKHGADITLDVYNIVSHDFHYSPNYTGSPYYFPAWLFSFDIDFRPIQNFLNEQRKEVEENVGRTYTKYSADVTLQRIDKLQELINARVQQQNQPATSQEEM